MPEVIAQEERRQSHRHEIPILPPILMVNNGAGLDFRDCRFTGVGEQRPRTDVGHEESQGEEKHRATDSFFHGRTVAELPSKTAYDKPPRKNTRAMRFVPKFQLAFRNYGLEEDVTFAGLLCN
jgi:hypothetical protein